MLEAEINQDGQEDGFPDLSVLLKHRLPHPTSTASSAALSSLCEGHTGNGLAFLLPPSHPRVYVQPHLLSSTPHRVTELTERCPEQLLFIAKTELITPTFMYPHLLFMSLFTLT